MTDVRYIHFKLTDVDDIIDDIEYRHDGLRVAPRAIENALRRKQLRFYQVGKRRYTSTALIDEWLESLKTPASAQ